ncbi:nitroreductase family protein [Campylobacter upsaliensis]
MNFKEMLEKRHACKLFDGRKIPEEDLKFILESGVLAPSSHGFEPWKFFVLNDRQEELSKLCFNQQNVATASHNIILVARKDLQEKDAFARSQIRRFSGSSEENFQRILQIYTHRTNQMSDKELYHYASLQCYLALMQMSLAAISIGVDSCMIGGFEKEKVDAFLKLKEPFESAVILSLGYKKNEPSSLGLEPWKFLVIKDAKKREELSLIANHQSHVKNAVVIVIIVSRLDFAEYFEEKLRKRKMSEEELNRRLSLYKPFLQSMDERAKIAYSREQAHIALAGILYAANTLNIATCTIGGFDSAKLNAYLNLDTKKELSTLMIALGYSDDEEIPAKSRFEFDEVVRFLD